MDARGKLAGILSFSACKGRHTARRVAKPAQPNTNKQLSARAALRFLCNAWSTLSDADKASWAELAAVDDLPPYNAFLKVNLARIQQDRAPSKAYPAAETLPPPFALVIYAPDEIRSCYGSAITSAEPDEWAAIIYRNRVDDFTPEPKYIVDILPCPGGEGKFEHHPMEPGNYYWRIKSFTTDGGLGIQGDWAVNTVLP